MSHGTRWFKLSLGVLAAVPLSASRWSPSSRSSRPSSDLSGEWGAIRQEDQPHRQPGPELGDYTGLPINAAARQKAETWDASTLSQPERQAQPHPAQYSLARPRRATARPSSARPTALPSRRLAAARSRCIQSSGSRSSSGWPRDASRSLMTFRRIRPRITPMWR